jgi:DNA-directed RNA polymerase specialized sigma subunit
MLYRHKEKIKHDIASSNFSIESGIKGIDYSKEIVKSSKISSPQEAGIESAFRRMEKQLKAAENEILVVECAVRDMEIKVNDIEFLINRLEKDAKMFVQLRYEQNSSFQYIGNELHISETSAWRFGYNILKDLSKWICVCF